jgi:hypothetical protein
MVRVKAGDLASERNASRISVIHPLISIFTPDAALYA